MRKLIAIAILAAGLNAHAEGKVYCSIMGQNPNEASTYDQTILNMQELTGEKTVIVKNGKLLDVDLTKFSTAKQWMSVDKGYLIGFAKQDNGRVAITIGKIDFVNHPENMFRLQTSSVGGSDLVNLIDHRNGLSASCFELK